MPDAMRATFMHRGCELTFTDADLVNDMEYAHGFNCDGTHDGRLRPFLLHDHGLTVAVVFARGECEALYEAADSGALDRFKVAPEDLKDYGDTDEERDEALTHLGNNGDPFDLEGLGVVELPIVPFSFVALFRAARNQAVEAQNLQCDKERARLSRELALQESMRDSAERALEEGDTERARACLARARGFRFEEEDTLAPRETLGSLSRALDSLTSGGEEARS